MLESDVYPPGVPCWIDIATPEPRRTAAFYGGVFGWEVGAAAGGSAYLVARRDGRAVAGIRPTGPMAVTAATAATVWRTYVCVDDAEAATGRMASAGGRISDGPAPVDGAGVAALVTDPAGATLGVWQPGKIRGAGLVNAANTWNFSNLTTPDPEGATAFYAAAFGWEARAVELGAGAGVATMWCLPGYGDTQDAKEQGFLRRHAESGTPEGFTDAFGWMEAAATSDTPCVVGRHVRGRRRRRGRRPGPAARRDRHGRPVRRRPRPARGRRRPPRSRLHGQRLPAVTTVTR